MTPQIQHLIGQAIESFQNGNLIKAEEILNRILAAHSKNLPALEILGLVKASQGQHTEAVKLLTMAIKLNPNNSVTQHNLAKALSESENYVQSIIHHEKALQLAPANLDGWLNYGQTLLCLNRYEAAITAFDKALSMNTRHTEAWYGKALAYSGLGQHESALDCYANTLQLNPDDEKIWLNASVCFGMLGRYQEAIGCCDRSLALQPNHPEAWLNKGSALNELKEFDKAIDCYQQALVVNKNYAEAWYSKGVALQGLEQYQAAIDAFDHAIAINDQYAQAYCNKGLALQSLKKFDEAIKSYDNAIAIKPDYVEAFSNKGLSYHEITNFHMSIEAYDHAINIEPTYAEAYFNKSFAQLILGNLDDGWPNYEYRWTKKHADSYLHADTPKLLTLNGIENKKILVWVEQGFGDTIQFARYIPRLIELGAKITFEVQTPLMTLFNGQYSCTLISKGAPIGDIDFQIPLLSLPLLFKTNLNSIPESTPYIRVSSEVIKEWRTKLQITGDKLNIGISCSGNANVDKKNGNKRQIPLHYFSELNKQHNLFLIQKDIRDADLLSLNELNNIHAIGELIQDFRDTAAIVENMDLIISIDTSLAHLAGALNKQLFVLLPSCPDWRWLASGSKSPWYPSATLFRQTSMGGWKSVMGEVASAINNAKPQILIY